MKVAKPNKKKKLIDVESIHAVLVNKGREPFHRAAQEINPRVDSNDFSERGKRFALAIVRLRRYLGILARPPFLSIYGTMGPLVTGGLF